MAIWKRKLKKRTCWLFPASPPAREVQIARAHLAREEDLYLKSNAAPEQARKEALESFCHLLFLTNEFLYID